MLPHIEDKPARKALATVRFDFQISLGTFALQMRKSYRRIMIEQIWLISTDGFHKRLAVAHVVFPLVGHANKPEL